MQALYEAAHHHTQVKAKEADFRSTLQKLRSRAALLQETLTRLADVREQRPGGSAHSRDVSPVRTHDKVVPSALHSSPFKQLQAGRGIAVEQATSSPLRKLQEARGVVIGKQPAGLAEAVEEMSAELKKLRSRCQRNACARHVQLRHEVRGLQEQLLDAHARRVRIEAARDTVEAERTESAAEQRRRQAQKALQMRQALCEELALKNNTGEQTRTMRHSMSGTSPRAQGQTMDPWLAATQRQRLVASSSGTQLRGGYPDATVRHLKPWMPRRST